MLADSSRINSCPKGIIRRTPPPQTSLEATHPAYDPNDTDHVNLSRLGRRAAVEAEKVIAGLGDPVPSVTKARSVLRHEWQPSSGVAQGIEAGVGRLLG